MSLRGGRRPGAGRKLGGKNKKTKELVREIAKAGVSPVDYMLGIMRDETQPQSVRLSAAGMAAPYLHPKLQVVAAKIDATPSLSDQEREAAEAESKRQAIEAFNRAFGRGEFATPEPAVEKEPEPVFVPKPEQLQRSIPSDAAVVADDRVTRLSRPHRRPRPLGSWSQ